jgi:hypothetical protein
LDSSGSGEGPMMGSCEHGNIPSCFTAECNVSSTRGLCLWSWFDYLSVLSACRGLCFMDFVCLFVNSHAGFSIVFEEKET